MYYTYHLAYLEFILYEVCMYHSLQIVTLKSFEARWLLEETCQTA